MIVDKYTPLTTRSVEFCEKALNIAKRRLDRRFHKDIQGEDAAIAVANIELLNQHLAHNSRMDSADRMRASKTIIHLLKLYVVRSNV